MCVAGVRYHCFSEATAAASSSCFDALLASCGLVRVPSHQQQQQEMTSTHVSTNPACCCWSCLVVTQTHPPSLPTNLPTLPPQPTHSNPQQHMPGVPPQVTGPLLALGAAVLLSVALKEALDRKDGKQRAKIPLHNPRAFRFELPGTASSSSSSSPPSGPTK